MLEKYLEEIGLSDKEATVYLALLPYDLATPTQIAEDTKINRSTVYVILESLAKKGLVSESDSEKTIRYQAAPPERLETYVERQKAILDEHSLRLKDLIPQIKSLSRKEGERPVVKFFEGRDGAVSAYEEFYETHESSTRKGYFIYNRDLLEATFSPAERERFTQIRLGKQVEPMSVYTKKDGPMEFKTKGTRTRIDGKEYPIATDVTIIEDKIIVTTLGERVSSILIRSKDLAVTLASLVRYINDMEKKKTGD